MSGAVDGPAWDVTTDPDNPQPQVWPTCGTCDAVWVYKRFMSFTRGGYVWAWAKPCKHKGDPVLGRAAKDAES